MIIFVKRSGKEGFPIIIFNLHTCHARTGFPGLNQYQEVDKVTCSK